MNESSFDHASFIRHASTLPGVYQMFNDSDELLYVGKAKNLKKRLSSYFRNTGLSVKTQSLVAQIDHIELTITHTESEALLLESNLIKQHHPRYNILLRDDKSYPYIFVSMNDDFPRISLHRGSRRAVGKYLGPFPNAGVVRESINFIQKLFRIRQCEDSYFKNRSRPCLQYQIRRCTAPCVGYITPQDYRQDIDRALLFLEGKSSELIAQMVTQMEQASADLNYEKAAEIRDRIRTLQKVSEKQYISGDSRDIDVVVCYSKQAQACVQVNFIRDGRHLGSRSYFPQLPEALEEAEVLAAFITQFYLAHEIPSEIILSHALNEQALIEETLGEQAQRKVRLTSQVRGDRDRWLQLARRNVEATLNNRLASRASSLKRFEALRDALQLDETPSRIECFDISHTRGELTRASCVVFGLEGPIKSDYRRFKIEGITGGDDYAAMRQVVQRRFSRLKKGEGKMPDVLFIDGGKGQLRQAIEVLDQLEIDYLLIIGVAKGEGRKAGLEKLVFSDGRPDVYLEKDSPAFHLILHLRDEAHRFAITGHRQQREKARKQSTLEAIPGLGPKRRQALIHHYGGLQGVRQAGVDELARVPGISRKLAQVIYDTLRSE